MTTSTTARYQPIIVLTAKERDALKRALNSALGIRPEDDYFIFNALNQLEDMI